MRQIAGMALLVGCCTLGTVASARDDCGARGDQPCPEKGRHESRADSAPVESGSEADWMHFELNGFHPFVGIGMLGGPVKPFSATTGRDQFPITGSFLFSLRGGFYAGRNEVAIELSPMTYVAYTDGSAGPQVQMAFNYTGLIPLQEGPTVSLYWPMRFGVGFVAGNTRIGRGEPAFLQLRFDLIGFAIKVGHVMIDLSLPSFRHLYSPGDQNGNFMFFTWHVGAQVSYIF